MQSFQELRAVWRADLYRYEGRADRAAFLKHWLLSPGFTFSFYLRLCAFLRGRRPALLMAPLYWLARLALRHYSYKFGIFIFPETAIGPGLYIGHCGDIHFNREARVGRNCNISQGVTLGQANRGARKGAPVIGDGVYIGPGAKIVGAVRVGDDVAIGANCVVTKDLPDHGVAVGVPAQVISLAGAAAYVEHLAEEQDTGAAPAALPALAAERAARDQ
jgi:serine O-acetyltransferase